MRNIQLVTAFFALFFGSVLMAEKSELKIAKQYGLAYLPLIVAEEHKLIEKNAKTLGLGNIKVSWLTLSGGATANDALLSNSVDLVSGGVAPLIRLWDKTNGKVKILASLNEAPQILNTSNLKIKTLRDFTDKDKIAVPSVKVSIQSLVLQIAAAKEYGIENYDKLDYLTVALKHSDAFVALTSGKSEITAHFTQEPFSTVELQNPNIHEVLNSYDVLGGKHTSNLVFTSEDFYKNNPKLSSAIISAIEEADRWINANKNAAAKLYLAASKSNEPLELVEEILSKPNFTYALKPSPNITLFSDFLFAIGAIKTKPSDWKELSFDKIH
ncbi:MAG: ABC transporter substrate-binding protein [Campylobacteraceae bacterium]|jgi:NitT/TauT family transport system substrate-binding protein|nr:ABC transporter substrate-binding protein [Campylobacteraceae bacterium]